MSFEQAVAQQPMWIQVWLYWLMFGAFVLPLALFIWRQSRIAAVASIVAGLLSGVLTNWIFEQYGYVKLLGLGHIPFWTPLAIYLFLQIRRGDMPMWPKRIMVIVLATLLISLAFDYVDVLRYILGERAPLA
jgi:uncharacterized membrane protein YeaQ/YmgE (transglycosylase-associated protein family)